MPATLKDVAELAGVSRSAVSRTFTDGASVSAKMRIKVEAAAKQLGYRPNYLASSLTTRRTKLIGLVSDNFHNPFFMQVFNLFTKGLQARGLRPLLVNLSDNNHPLEAIPMLQQYSVDGVIVASSTLPAEFAQQVKSHGIPVVHSFGRHTDKPMTHVVGVDNRACGRMATESLIKHGYTSIGFMGGPESATTTQDRLAGFLDVVQSHPEIDYSYSFAKAYTFPAGREEMLNLIAEGPHKAYFCGDDVTGIGALSAIESSGLRCPDDIGVIGFNNMEIAGWENINLSTISVPIRRIISTSVELIVDMIEHPDHKPESRLFNGQFIERGTLCPLKEA